MLPIVSDSFGSPLRSAREKSNDFYNQVVASLLKFKNTVKGIKMESFLPRISNVYVNTVQKNVEDEDSGKENQKKEIGNGNLIELAQTKYFAEQIFIDDKKIARITREKESKFLYEVVDHVESYFPFVKNFFGVLVQELSHKNKELGKCAEKIVESVQYLFTGMGDEVDLSFEFNGMINLMRHALLELDVQRELNTAIYTKLQTEKYQGANLKKENDQLRKELLTKSAMVDEALESIDYLNKTLSAEQEIFDANRLLWKQEQNYLETRIEDLQFGFEKVSIELNKIKRAEDNKMFFLGVETEAQSSESIALADGKSLEYAKITPSEARPNAEMNSMPLRIEELKGDSISNFSEQGQVAFLPNLNTNDLKSPNTPTELKKSSSSKSFCNDEIIPSLSHDSNQIKISLLAAPSASQNHQPVLVLDEDAKTFEHSDCVASKSSRNAQMEQQKNCESSFAQKFKASRSVLDSLLIQPQVFDLHSSKSAHVDPQEGVTASFRNTQQELQAVKSKFIAHLKNVTTELEQNDPALTSNLHVSIQLLKQSLCEMEKLDFIRDNTYLQKKRSHCVNNLQQDHLFSSEFNESAAKFFSENSKIAKHLSNFPKVIFQNAIPLFHLSAVVKWIRTIYKTLLNVRENEERGTTTSRQTKLGSLDFPDFVYHVNRTRYGLEELSMQKLSLMLLSAAKFRHFNFEVEIFCDFVEEKRTQAELLRYLSFRTVTDQSYIGLRLPSGSESSTVAEYVCRNRCINVVKQIFANFPQTVARLIGKLDEAAVAWDEAAISSKQKKFIQSILDKQVVGSITKGKIIEPHISGNPICVAQFAPLHPSTLRFSSPLDESKAKTYLPNIFAKSTDITLGNIPSEHLLSEKCILYAQLQWIVLTEFQITELQFAMSSWMQSLFKTVAKGRDFCDRSEFFELMSSLVPQKSDDEVEEMFQKCVRENEDNNEREVRYSSFFGLGSHLLKCGYNFSAIKMPQIIANSLDILEIKPIAKK